MPARFRSEDEVRNKRKRHHLPVKLADGVVYLTFKGSGLITSIAHADGLVAIGENVTLPEGEVGVRVLWGIVVCISYKYPLARRDASLQATTERAPKKKQGYYSAKRTS
jgi:hypothetical protein